MEYRKLGNTDMNVSILSYGASSLGSVFRDINEARGIEAVHVSVERGINFIDCSPYYGVTKAETVLGKALETLDRDKFYLATKVGQYDHGVFDFSAKRVKKSVHESLERCRVDVIDLIQCHDIEFADVDQIVNETLPALHELKAEGLVRYVGITGLPLKVLRETINRSEPGMIDTILSFSRYCLNDHALAEMFDLCESRGIGVINSAPTSMGLLTPRGCPDWHPASVQLARHCEKVIKECQDKGWDITQIAMQFSCREPRIASTLVGSANPDNMIANIEAVEAPYDAEKVDAVLEMLKPVHNFNFTRGFPENQDAIVC
ncbi:MAG: aldo/keto reductase [Planctomycetota bacterium]